MMNNKNNNVCTHNHAVGAHTHSLGGTHSHTPGVHTHSLGGTHTHTLGAHTHEQA